MRIPGVGGELTGEALGSGPPVLFIHGAVLVDTFDCVRAAPALSGSQLITYRRRGFGDSAAHRGSCSIVAQAADAAAVLNHFGVDRAHVVGHSYGASIALQLALDVPAAVHTLSLLEPPIPAAPANQTVAAGMGAVIRMFRSGDERGATDTFLQMVGGSRYAESLHQTLSPGWFDRAVADIETSLTVEFPALGEWRFGDDEIRRITQPCLTVLGEGSVIGEGVPWLEERLPDVTPFRVPGATHLLQLDGPSAVVERLVAFFAAHPLPDAP